MPPKKDDTTADIRLAAGSPATGDAPAKRAPQHKATSPPPEDPGPHPPEQGFTPDQDKSLSENWAACHYDGDLPRGVLHVINRFLAPRGVENRPLTVRALYPSGWQVGRTEIPCTGDNEGIVTLRAVTPNVRGWSRSGNEVYWADGGEFSSHVDRLTAEWDSPVEIVAGILSAVRGRRVDRDAVLDVAQKSPQALEKLKEAGKVYKAHFQRLLDPVALRRSPEFNEVAQRYKQELRALIDEQQRLIREARAATRRVNQLLGERDEALSRLDPGYEAKRVTAAEALRRHGIDLGESEAGGGVALEDDAGADALANLDF